MGVIREDPPLLPGTLRAVLAGAIAQEPVRVVVDVREQAAWLLAEALDDPRGDARFMPVPAATVEPRVFAAARAGTAFAAAHLRVTAPTLMFFRREGKAEAWFRAQFGDADWPSYRGSSKRLGYAAEGLACIGVSAHVQPSLAVEIAAHEVFHLAHPGRDEDDAYAYGNYAGDVLAMTGRVANFVTPDRLGDARPGDVQVTSAGEVLWNLGSAGEPSWETPYVRCPVDCERRT